MEEFMMVLNYFLENPFDEVYLRELAKILNLSPFAIKKYSDKLVKEGLILDRKKANLRFFKANKDNIVFKQFKIAYNVKIISDSGLLDYVGEEISNLSSIVLYGSVSKGEDDKNSDFDILIIGKKKNLDVNSFLNKEINMQIFSWSEWKKQMKTNPAYYYDIIQNGIALYGDTPVVK